MYKVSKQGSLYASDGKQRCLVVTQFYEMHSEA